MKTRLLIHLIIIIPFFILSCDKKENAKYHAPCKKIVEFQACGINDIGNNLKWLNDIINTSNTDHTGNYLGTIWYKNYNNQDVIVTDMSFGSEITYYAFNCSGESIVIDFSNFFSSLTQRDIIWTNVCID
jgi:hypothetical protein